MEGRRRDTTIAMFMRDPVGESQARSVTGATVMRQTMRCNKLPLPTDARALELWLGVSSGAPLLALQSTTDTRAREHPLDQAPGERGPQRPWSVAGACQRAKSLLQLVATVTKVRGMGHAGPPSRRALLRRH